MTAKHLIMTALATIVALGVSVSHAAEQVKSGTVQVIIPWEGEGRVYRVAPNRMKFLGEIQGIMYIESSKGEMHEAFVSCPVTQELYLESVTTTRCRTVEHPFVDALTRNAPDSCSPMSSRMFTCTSPMRFGTMGT